MAETSSPTSRGYASAFFGKLFGWLHGFPSETSSYTTQEATIPGADGVKLAATLYLPVTRNGSESVGTILVRTPYGREGPMMLPLAGVWAAREYTVLVVSIRGTSGSTGTFDPTRTEVHDGLACVKWMRQQAWYTGRFATLGMSYLGFTQYALMHSDDPLTDYVAAVISVCPHDFAELAWGNGSFWLTMIDWAATMVDFSSSSWPYMLFKLMTSSANGAIEVKRKVPLVGAVKSHFARFSAQQTQWLYPWLEGSRAAVDADPEGFWAPMRHGAVLETTKIPILLNGGFQDIFSAQTIEQYRRLSARKDATVALTVGPFDHSEGANGKEIQMDSWVWMEKYLARRSEGSSSSKQERPAPVHLKVSGVNEWRWLESWPPVTKPLTLYLGSGSGSDSSLQLVEQPSNKVDSAEFTFDPHDPTPTYGGPLLARGGQVDDSALAARADVLVFDTPVLDHDTELMGRPHLELVHSSDNVHADLFVRLCCVTVKKGVNVSSTNLCETYQRLDPERTNAAGDKIKIELDLTDCAHRFVKGTRIRVLIAGGCFPQWAFNLGTGEQQGTGTTMKPARHAVHIGGQDGSKLVLPVAVSV